jgi:hypothetical protein
MTWLALATEPVPGWLSSVYPGFGIAGADIPADGDNGPSPVLNDGTIIADAEYSWELVSGPVDAHGAAAGVLTLYENLTFLFDATGIPAGIYSFVYRLRQMGIVQGTATVSITVGDVAGGVLDAAAAGVSVAIGTAGASVSVPLVATGLVIADGAAGATASVSVSAAGLAQAAASAGLSASVLLAGAGAAQAAGNGHLTALLEMLAAGAAEASGSAQLSGGAQGDVSASGQASAGGAGVLTVTVSLSAAGVAQASGTASGSAGSPGDVSAAGGAVADGSATWSAVLQLTAPGFVQAMGAGALSVDVSLVAAGAGQASGQARASVAGAVAAYCISSSARRVTEIVSGVRLVTTINHEVRCVCD